MQIWIGAINAAGTYKRTARLCATQGTDLSASFLHYNQGPRIRAVAAALDWPIRLWSAELPQPHMLDSDAAACVAVFTWVQWSLGYVVPTALLWLGARPGRRRGGRAPSSPLRSDRSNGGSSSDDPGSRWAADKASGVALALLDWLLHDQPALQVAALVTWLWLLIRVACWALQPS